MNTTRLLIASWFLVVQGFAQTDASQKTSSDEVQTILAIANSVWTAMSLGDMEDLKPLIREIDVQHIPTPKGEGAEMMAMKNLEQLKPLREEIKMAVKNAFVLEQPNITEDKMAANVKIKPNADKMLSWYELKMVYDIYMAEAYQDKKANREPQPLETVKKKVLAQDSQYRKGIDKKVAGAQKAQLPTLYFERTEKGWRADLSKMLGK